MKAIIENKLRDIKGRYSKLRIIQKQVFDSRSNMINKPKEGKYGDKSDYNETCMKSVENISYRLRNEDNGKITYKDHAILVESILKNLAKDRHSIALEKEKNLV